MSIGFRRDDFQLFKRVLSYCRGYVGMIMLSILFSGIVALCTVYPAYIVKDLVDKVLCDKNQEYIRLISVSVVIVMLIKGIFGFASQYMMQYALQRIILKIRSHCFNKLTKLSLGFYASQQTGQLMSRVTNDVGVLQSLVNNFVRIIRDFIELMGFIVYIFWLNWKLSLLSLVIAPLIGALLDKFSRKMKKIGIRMQERVGDINSVLHEFITGIKVVKSFTLEKFMEDKYENSNEESFQETMRGSRINCATTPIVELINSFSLVVIFWYGGYLVVDGILTAGDVVSFITALIGLFKPIRDLSDICNTVSQSLGAASRVFELIDTEIDIKEPENPVQLENCKGEVEFKNVTFAYKNDETILSNINLKVKPGEVIALVGPSGAGKSTFVNLIPRFFDTTEGELLIDGMNVRTLSGNSLRGSIGMVPQETYLFAGTIRDNIRFGKLDATDEEVEEAAKLANAHDFILSQPEGYETHLGERGVNLSGGQAQRVALARAFLKNPSILILDEATSALDSETETLIQQSLDRLMKNRTTFMIAHRLSTVVNADRIIALEKGRIVEAGKHEDLIEKKGLYYQLYTAQHKKELEQAAMLP